MEDLAPWCGVTCGLVLELGETSGFPLVSLEKTRKKKGTLEMTPTGHHVGNFQFMYTNTP